MKTIFFGLILMLCMSVQAQTITQVDFVSKQVNGSTDILILTIDNSHLIKQIFVEVGSSEEANDQLDGIYFPTVQGGQHGFQVLTDGRSMITLTELSASAPHFFRIRLEDQTGQIGPAFLYQYGQ
ncbi:MAG: hypothetical protein AAFQ87_15145 [Bacteroidota bacterium]